MRVYLLTACLLGFLRASPLLLNPETPQDNSDPQELEEQVTDPSSFTNEKDDYDIYSYGLIGQEHPELIPQVMMSVTQFPKMIELSQLWNRLYNEHHNIVPEDPEVSKSLSLKAQKGLERFEIAKQIFRIMATESQMIKEEVDSAIANYDKLTMTKEDLLIIFDLQDYYEDILTELNPRDPVILDMGSKLELIVYEFLSRMGAFIVSVDSARFFSKVTTPIIEPFAKENVIKDSSDLATRVDMGMAMVDTIVDLKKQTDYLGANLKASTVLMHDLRKQVVNVINQLNEARVKYNPDQVKEFQKKYCETKGVRIYSLPVLLAIIVASLI